MQEIHVEDNEEKETPRNYKPPLFTRDYFDNLMKGDRKNSEDGQGEPDMKEEKDFEPAKSVFQRVLGLFRKEEDLSAIKVNF